MNPLFCQSRLLAYGLVLHAVVMAHLTAVVSLYAQTLNGYKFKFEHISVDQGLSQCTVSAIYQDSRGFLWFGTSDGLNRYDGYSFKHYKHDPSDSNSLSHNGVTTITEEGLGRLWIGTAEGGINRYDRRHDRFIRYQHDPHDPQSLSHNHIEFIFADSFGILWIVTRGGGLNAFDWKTEKFTHYRHEPGNPNSLSHDAPNGIIEDKDKTLWVFTREVLHRFDRRTGTFKRLIVVTNLDEAINTVFEDHNGRFWIGTLRSGLKIFDRQTERFTHAYRHDPRDLTTIGNDRVTAICEDLTGVLWITTDNSVNRFDRSTGKFLRFQHDPQNPNSLGRGVCTRMYRDRSGLLWIETDGSGLNKLDPRPPKFTHIKHEPDNPNSLSNDLPKAICEDRFGDLWIGNVWGKLDRYNRRTGKFTHYQNDSNDPYSLSSDGVSDGVFAIYEDQEGILWIGAGNGGLNRFDRERETFANHSNDAGRRLGITRAGVNVIGEDREGCLWLGGDSLRKYDKRTGKTQVFFHQADDSSSISNNQILVIYTDQKGSLWVGTANGLNQFERATGTFKRYLHVPGNPNSLGNNYIKTIVEDRYAKLWIGTQDGLNRFDPETKIFARYHEEDGLPNTFIYGILGDDHGNLWVARYNSPVNSTDEARGLAVDASGNVYVSGYSPGAIWNHDCFTIKYNSAGVRQWTARYNGPGNGEDIINALAIDAAGNVYVTGHSFGSNGSQDFTTIKYNNAGLRQWVARYNSPANNLDEARDIAVDAFGNVYVTGYSITANGHPDYITIKYTASDVNANNAQIAEIESEILHEIETVEQLTPEKNNAAPIDFVLSQNYPNPFNSTTTIGFSLPVASEVRVTIYNIKGELVRKLMEGNWPAGYHELTFDASGLASGTYLYRLEADSFTATRTMTLTK